MNKNLNRKFATVALAAGLLGGSGLALAPAALADTAPEPTPVSVGVIQTDGEQDVVAITIGAGDIHLEGQVAVPCADLDESVRVYIDDQPNFCYVDRSHLARGVDMGDVSPITGPEIETDGPQNIVPISAPLANIGGPATDAANSGKWLSIGLSALAVAGTAFSLTRNRRVASEI